MFCSPLLGRCQWTALLDLVSVEARAAEGLWGPDIQKVFWHILTLINTSLTRFVHTSLKVDGRLCYLEVESALLPGIKSWAGPSLHDASGQLMCFHSSCCHWPVGTNEYQRNLQAITLDTHRRIRTGSNVFEFLQSSPGAEFAEGMFYYDEPITHRNMVWLRLIRI